MAGAEIQSASAAILRKLPAKMTSKRTNRTTGARIPEAPVISFDESTAEPDRFSITVLSTGGTISKTYDEHTAVMRNDKPMAVRIIQSLRLPGTRVKYRNLLNKDSLHFTDADR